MDQRILMVVTSNGRMGETGKPTGFWAEEVAEPYYALKDAGVSVVIVSPEGGPVPLDPGSVKDAGQNPPAVERMLRDLPLQGTLQHTAKLAHADVSAFDAVFFPGGHGTMWDLPDDPAVARAVETAARKGKVVAAVCHGVAALVGAKREDGRPFVEGRRLNSFTDAEERAAGLADTVPFLLESRLRELGARFEGGPDWQPYAVRDGRLITGQNPQSSTRVAELVLQALREPVPAGA